MLSAVSIAGDAAIDKGVLVSALHPPAFILTREADVPGYFQSSVDLGRTSGKTMTAGKDLDLEESLFRPYVPPTWTPSNDGKSTTDPWLDGRPGNSGTSPDSAPTAPDGSSLGGYIELEASGSPATTLDSRITVHEIREVEKVLSALLFVPTIDASEPTAFTKEALTAAIDAILAGEPKPGDAQSVNLAPEGGMVANERQALQPPTFSQSQQADIETLLDAPARIESRYGRFQTLEVSVLGQPTSQSPASSTQQPAKDWPLATPTDPEAEPDSDQQPQDSARAFQGSDDGSEANEDMFSESALHRLGEGIRSSNLRSWVEYVLAASAAVLMMRVSARILRRSDDPRESLTKLGLSTVRQGAPRASGD